MHSLVAVCDIKLLRKLARNARIYAGRVDINGASSGAVMMYRVAELVDIGRDDFSRGAFRAGALPAEGIVVRRARFARRAL